MSKALVNKEFLNTPDSSEIGFTSSGTGAITVTVQSKLRESVNAKDFAVPSNGTTSATSAIQAMFAACVSSGNVKEIVFDSGTYLLTCSDTATQLACAVVINGLKRCAIRGMNGAKFIVGTGGTGAAQFGMFRLEGCEDLEFCDFEMDGSGITITGTGANRSRGFVLTNFNTETQTDLLVLNKRIRFHNLNIHDIGGVLLVARRSGSLAATPVTDGLEFKDNIITDALGQDGGVGVNFVRNGVVRNNRFTNSTATAPMDSMAVDASQGCENFIIENNYVYGFMFGMKCETATAQGPALNEIRPSKRVLILNNTLEEIGDPASFSFGGSGTYGIKVNGINCIAKGNTVKHRTIGVTTGGLASGVIVFNTHDDFSQCTIEGNYIKGCQYGYVHTDATVPSNRKATTRIVGNRTDDASIFGIVGTSNLTIENNQIHRASKAAVNISGPDTTIVRENFAFNCGIANSDFIASRVVWQQENASVVGYFEFTDNVTIDTRGASAANYAYFLRGGQVAGNYYVFSPGYTTGLVTGISFDQYTSAIGQSLQLAGTNVPSPRTISSTNIPSSTAPFSTTAWNVGDRAIRSVPSIGSPKAWICTVAGTPGTWVSEGNL